MPTELPTSNGNNAQDGENTFAVKAGLARMLKGGVIMDVVNAEQVRRQKLSGVGGAGMKETVGTV
jgi:pyridoxal 5'-phosphate synthase pdxS subunit